MSAWRPGHSAVMGAGRSLWHLPTHRSTLGTSSSEERGGRRGRSWKELWNRADGAQNLVMSLPGCVASGKLLSLPEPPHRSDGMRTVPASRTGETYTRLHLDSARHIVTAPLRPDGHYQDGRRRSRTGGAGEEGRRGKEAWVLAPAPAFPPETSVSHPCAGDLSLCLAPFSGLGWGSNETPGGQGVFWG